MATKITLQAGGTQPAFRFQTRETSDTLDQALPLAGKTVVLRFGPKGRAATWERNAVIDTAAEGRCHYEWSADDLAVSGEFWAQAFVVYGDGSRRPCETWDIEILPSIPAPIIP